MGKTKKYPLIKSNILLLFTYVTSSLSTWKMSTSLTEVTNLKDKIKTNAHFDKRFKVNEWKR